MVPAQVRSLIFLGFCCCVVTVRASDPGVVLVGGYIFPPYVIEESADHYNGATPELIGLLNQYQSQFRFEFIPIAAHSRQHAWQQERFDVILFESPHWQWHQEDIEFTP